MNKEADRKLAELQAQQVVSSSTRSNWGQPRSGVPQALILQPLLYSIFINELDDGTECTLRQLADNMKLGEVVDTPDRCAAI